MIGHSVAVVTAQDLQTQNKLREDHDLKVDMLSDADLQLKTILEVPTLQVEGYPEALARGTLVIGEDNSIVAVWDTFKAYNDESKDTVHYVKPADHADQVYAHLAQSWKARIRPLMSRYDQWEEILNALLSNQPLSDERINQLTKGLYYLNSACVYQALKRRSWEPLTRWVHNPPFA